MRHSRLKLRDHQRVRVWLVPLRLEREHLHVPEDAVFLHDVNLNGQVPEAYLHVVAPVLGVLRPAVVHATALLHHAQHRPKHRAERRPVVHVVHRPKGQGRVVVVLGHPLVGPHAVRPAKVVLPRRVHQRVLCALFRHVETEPAHPPLVREETQLVPAAASPVEHVVAPRHRQLLLDHLQNLHVILQGDLVPDAPLLAVRRTPVVLLVNRRRLLARQVLQGDLQLVLVLRPARAEQHASPAGQTRVAGREHVAVHRELLDLAPRQLLASQCAPLRFAAALEVDAVLVDGAAMTLAVDDVVAAAAAAAAAA
eukprot:Rhum_TRINITY_DN15205_c11_g1::Rhum_TRINITY_DN15205_c11_g1_i1::g.145830::m.145830